MRFWAFLTVSAICLVAAVLATQAGSILGQIAWAGATWMFADMAKRER